MSPRLAGRRKGTACDPPGLLIHQKEAAVGSGDDDDTRRHLLQDALQVSPLVFELEHEPLPLPLEAPALGQIDGEGHALIRTAGQQGAGDHDGHAAAVAPHAFATGD